MSNDVPVVIPTCLTAAQKPERLNTRFWANSAVVGSFKVAITHTEPSQATEVRLCYDKRNLYIRFDCLESDLQSMLMSHKNDGDPVWDDDCIHVLISPRSAAAKFTLHRFVISATGAKTHLPPSWASPETNWAAAVTMQPDRWVAEIILPLEILKPTGRNEDCWRINFCRHRRPSNERSTWAPIGNRLMDFGAMGKMIAPANAPFRFNSLRGRPITLPSSDGAAEGAHAFSEAAANLQTELMIPEPQEVHWRVSKAGFRIGPETKVVVDDDAGPSDIPALDAINCSIRSLGGRAIEPISASDFEKSGAPLTNVILLGESARNTCLRGVCDVDAIRMPRSRYNTGSYVVDVMPERVVAAGQSPRETYYAAETLRHLIRLDETQGMVIPSVSVRDYPRFNYRALHLSASAETIEALPRLIESVLAPLKVSKIILDVTHVSWKSLAAPGGDIPPARPEDVREVVRFAEQHHMRTSPLMPDWLRLAHQPQDTESLEEYLSLIDEACDAFVDPKVVHIGGSGRGTDEMRQHEHPSRYVSDLLRFHDHLAEGNCQMMMWGDVMIKPGYRDLIGSLPKDILIADRSCTPGGDCSSLDFYRGHGFQVMLCTWYEPAGAYALLTRAVRHGISGVVQTPSLTPPTEEPPPDCERDAHAIVHSAAWAWNPTRPDPANLPYRPQSVFERLWREGSCAPHGEYRTISLKRYFNMSRCDSGRAIGWLGEGRGNDLRNLPAGPVNLDGVPYEIGPCAVDEPAVVVLGSPGLLDRFPDEVKGIRVGARAKSLHFLHSCARGADSCLHVGSFVMNFADGGSEEMPMNYRAQCFAWDDQSSEAVFDYVWKSKSQDGRTIGLCDTHWENPKPDRVIESIDFVSGGTQASPLLLAITMELG